MSEHRVARTRPRLSRLRSVRVRALLCLGLVTAVACTGTFAYWTDDVVVSGTTFTSGSILLKGNGLDAVTTATLSMTSAPGTPMVPGATSAEVFTVSNAGTSPLKYTLAGGLGGTDAAAYGTAGSLKLTVVSGGTRTGTGNAVTCTGGTTIVTPVALTDNVATGIITTRRGPLTPSGGSESLCFQVTFDANAPSTLQGKTATATFTLTGTSDVS